MQCLVVDVPGELQRGEPEVGRREEEEDEGSCGLGELASALPDTAIQ